MRVKVFRLWRKGQKIPKWQFATVAGDIGELRMEESKDEDLRRHLRMARLIGTPERGSSADVLPPLHDAAVLYIKQSLMSISGFERDDSSGVPIVYVQTWRVEIEPQVV